jgi:hypothetical protein
MKTAVSSLAMAMILGNQLQRAGFYRLFFISDSPLTAPEQAFIKFINR